MYISVDVGGTNTRVAAAESLECPQFTAEPVRWRNSTDYAAEIATIVEVACHLGGTAIEAVGIGIVGDLDDARTRMEFAKNNMHWNGRPFVADISRSLGPVFVESDAAAAALGEAYYGSGAEDFAYVVWGTGVGGAHVRRNGGQVEVDNFAGQWWTYFSDWEKACGGSELVRTYGRPTEELTQREWREILEQFTGHAAHFADKCVLKRLFLAAVSASPIVLVCQTCLSHSASHAV